MKLHSKEPFRSRLECFAGNDRTFRRRLDLCGFLKSIDTITHHFRRNGEPESLRGNPLWCECHLCRRDAYQSAGEIDHWPTTITWIDCRIGLHEVFVFRIVHCDIALHRAKNTTADRAAVTDSVTHYNHCLPKQIGGDIVEVDERQGGARLDFNERQVGLVIAGNVASVISFTVICRHVNFQVRRALDYVLIGYDVTSRINNETGTKTLQSLANLARPGAVVAEKLRVKIFEGIAHGAPNDPFSIDVHHCRQHLTYSQNRRFRRRVGLCKTRCRRREH